MLIYTANTRIFHPNIIGEKLQRDRTTILYYLDIADYAINGKYPLLKEMIDRSEGYLLSMTYNESIL